MLKNLFLICIINILTIALVEYFVGFFIHQKNIRNFTDTKRVVTPYRPLINAWLNSNEFSVPYYINNIGVRGYEKKDIQLDKYSSVLLGDSFSEGWGVPYSKSFIEQINQTKESKILNFSQNGSGPLLFYHRLKYLMTKTRLDKVIIQIFDNDIMDNYRIKNFNPDIKYQIKDDSLFRKITNWFKANTKIYYLVKLFERKIRNLPLPSFQFESLNKVDEIKSDEDIEKQYELSKNLSKIESFKAGDFGWYLPNKLNDWSEKISLHKVYLQKIIDLCNDNGITLEFIYIPYHGVWYLNKEDKGKIRNYHQELLGELSSKNSIKFYDFFSLMSTHKNPKSLYFPMDGHLNQDGHKFVSDTYLNLK